ncbi:hypothetical protein GKE82_05545 [Conexibacter sp. W3-3-2]|nr:hypothetical protein [Conexibacter sp. W3-3-2]
MSKVTADRSVSRKVTHRVLAGGERAWSVSDFDDLGTPDAINSALRRLVEDEQLRRVRRGVYWRGRESKFGMTPTPGHAVVREVLGDQGGHRRSRVERHQRTGPVHPGPAAADACDFHAFAA